MSAMVQTPSHPWGIASVGQLSSAGGGSRYQEVGPLQSNDPGQYRMGRGGVFRRPTPPSPGGGGGWWRLVAVGGGVILG
jgi:hypothetical protein